MEPNKEKNIYEVLVLKAEGKVNRKEFRNYAHQAMLLDVE